MLIREKHEIATYSWNLKELIENSYPFIKFSKKTTSLLDEYKRSKIIVVTYNGTALLETMMFDIPTIIFYNFKVWRIKPEVKKKYQLLC